VHTHGLSGSARTNHVLYLLLFAAVMAALPWVFRNEYYITVLIFLGINVILVVGLNALMGYAGQISLGHAAFFACGAYISGIANTRLGLSPWITFPVGMLLTGCLAFLIGKPILRLKGNYLAMATLGFGLIVEHLLVEWGEWTGGPSGLIHVERLSIGSIQLYAPGVRYYYLVWFFVLCVIIVVSNLVDSRVGRALRALHGSELAARALGVDTARYKLQVFVLSALLAALGGGLYVHYLGFIAPASCGLNYSIGLVTMVVVGGMANLWGSVLGAAFLTLLPQFLTVLRDYDIVVYGLILVMTVLFLPHGIAQGVAVMVRAVKKRAAAGGEG